MKKKNKTINKKKPDNVKKLKAELSDLKNKNIRLLAEFDNFKKRNLEDKRKLLKYDGVDFVVSLLPILDDIDRTLSLKELKSNKTIFDGINMIRDKINKTLEEKGIKTYISLNKSFDTEYHEALMMKKSKKKSGIILEEFEKGYLYHDKVIRHAKVVVSE
tara:strand:+ start:25 stop:504 length:480 start_codon:yes stop_codon:yes gene_type:complete